MVGRRVEGGGGVRSREPSALGVQETGAKENSILLTIMQIQRQSIVHAEAQDLRKREWLLVKMASLQL